MLNSSFRCGQTSSVRQVRGRRILKAFCSQQAQMTETKPTVRVLKAQEITPEAFKPFGQVIGITEDGKEYDHQDAQLQGFDAGTPRFYIMRLPPRSLKFTSITFHGKVTQCLGLLNPMTHWYMAVARPSGSVDKFPKEEDLSVFKIPHGVYVKLEKGTWHAGPLYEGQDHMDFYNLELSNTNKVDFNSHDYLANQNLEFHIVDELPAMK